MCSAISYSTMRHSNLRAMIEVIGYVIHNGHIHGWQPIDPPILAENVGEIEQLEDAMMWDYLVESCIENGYKKKNKATVKVWMSYRDLSRNNLKK